MRVLSRLRPALLLVTITAAGPAAFGADPATAPAKPAGSAPTAASQIADRLFLTFSQDAALVPSQWWEGQIEFADGKNDDPDVFLVRGVFAFHPIKSLEVGGNVGFGRANAPGRIYDGNGATDLDIYGKWVFANVASNTDVSAGVLLTVPTGDDTAGLGYNAFASQVFGGVRYRTEPVVIGAHVGIRYNGTGRYQTVGMAGKTSLELAVSALFPLANQVSVVGEAQFESDRFEDRDASTQLLVGVNWRAFRRGTFRGALAGGLTDGAANFRLILGYAYNF